MTFITKRKVECCFTNIGIISVIVIICFLSSILFNTFEDDTAIVTHSKKHHTANDDGKESFVYCDKISFDGSDHTKFSNLSGVARSRLHNFNHPGEFVQNYDDRKRPNPRMISNYLAKKSENSTKHWKLRSLTWSFAQLVSRDISVLECEAARKLVVVDVDGDRHFSTLFHTKMLSIDASRFQENPVGFRHSVSSVSQMLDASFLYGSSVARTNELREFKNGQLKSQFFENLGEFPLYNVNRFENKDGDDKKNLFLYGILFFIIPSILYVLFKTFVFYCRR